MANKKPWGLIFLVIVIGFMLYQYTDLFSITSNSPLVQYNNGLVYLGFQGDYNFFSTYFNDQLSMPVDCDRLDNNKTGISCAFDFTNKTDKEGILKATATSCTNNAPVDKVALESNLQNIKPNNYTLIELSEKTSGQQCYSELITTTYLAPNQFSKYKTTQGIELYYKSNNSYYWCGGKNLNILIKSSDAGLFDNYMQNYPHNCTSESVIVEVKKPYVTTKNNIPATIDVGESTKIEIQVFNPQGESVDADSVDIDVYDPNNDKTTLFLDKSGNVFSKNYKYILSGNYIFKIHARETGYDTKEDSTITSVLKSEGIPLIIWIWFGAIGLWIILFAIRRYRRR